MSSSGLSCSSSSYCLATGRRACSAKILSIFCVPFILGESSKSITWVTPLNHDYALEGGESARVTEPELGRVVVHVTVTTHDLDRPVTDLHALLGGVVLCQRGVFRVLIATVALPGRLPEEHPARVHLDEHLGYHERDRLAGADRLPPGDRVHDSRDVHRGGREQDAPLGGGLEVRPWR